MWAFLETFSLFSKTGAQMALCIGVGYAIADRVILPVAGDLASRAASKDHWAPLIWHKGTLTHVFAASMWPMLLGAWLGLFYAFDREIFVWYVQDALTWWPDYGSLTCWAVNGAAVCLAVGLLGLAAGVFRAYGCRGGLVLLTIALPVAVAAFCAGILSAPAVLVLASVVTRSIISPLGATIRSTIILAGEIVPASR